MNAHKMQLVDWLDDLCVRFIVNLPEEELESVERICFQIEEAQWFYEDFIRPLDPSMPSMNLRKFSMLMFQHCPLSSNYSERHHEQAYEQFLAYKTRVPVRGAIMLNQDMTHAVLVKGWKKGAKWSFPRGKINKEESDLDCAVREVYEETGYDIKDAGLVGPEHQMKKISVSMREQDMTLYVFRGVPMDTFFEPKTRKEISKIDWYKLTDLPTLKRKHHVQQGAGQDLIKDNNFYMVAPFLGPLKGWIKQQHKLDKHRAKTGAYLAPPATTGVTDTEADVGDTTADEAPIPETQPSDSNFANLIANLGRGHRSSDALPEVSAQQQTPQILDPAEELKRLLSIGGGVPGLLTQVPVEAPASVQNPPANPLLAMLQGNSNPPPRAPHTPVDQFTSPPPQPQSPHGQHHPRPPHIDHMPPPHFPFHPQQMLPFRGPQPPHMPPQNINGVPVSIPRQFLPPPPYQTEPVFTTHAPNVQQAFRHDQQAPKPFQRTGDPEFAPPTEFSGIHGPAIPPASKLPAPKLNAHTLGLLNAFKSLEKPTTQESAQPPQSLQNLQENPQMQQQPVHQRFDGFASPPSISANPYAPSPPPFQSPPQHPSFQPVQPKPRSAHQDNLLNLFRAQSVAATTPPPAHGAEPAELSAFPHTPGHARAHKASREPGPPPPNLSIKPNLLEAFGQPSRKPEITSATVSGPVNVPDFDTVKKHVHASDANGHSRGPSPAQRRSVEPQQFVPSQILRRQGNAASKASPTDASNTTRTASPKTTSNMSTPQAATFKPQILKRPSPAPAPGQALNLLNDMSNQMSPPQQVHPGPARLPQGPTTVQQAFDRRETALPGQKNTLLSLFQKPSQPSASPVPASTSPLPPQGLPKPPVGLPSLPSKSPLPRSPPPPTPKSITSGIISPVSPLPDKSSAQNSPAHLASRSRISSIGETMPPNIVIPKELIPTSDPATAIQRNGNGGLVGGLEEGYSSTGSTGPRDSLSAADKGKAKATSPIDKTFLLGFLENVARGGR